MLGTGQHARRSPRVLFVTSVPFWELNRGCSQRIDSLVQYLAQQFPVSVCWIGQMAVADWAVAQQRLPVPLFGPGQPAFWQKQVQRLGAAINLRRNGVVSTASKASTKPVTIESFYSEVIGKSVSRLVRRLNIDVVIIEYVALSYVADFVRRDHPGTAIALDSHDVMHLRKKEFARMGYDHWLDIDRDVEAESLRKFDAIIAIQAHDAQEFANMVPDTSVIVAPYGCTPKGDAKPTVNAVPIVGFLGSDGDANRLGLIEFLDQCWPAISERCDGLVELMICGAVTSVNAERDRWPRTRFMGEIADLSRFYSQVDVTINPSLIGSGLKIKSIESLIWGVPHVTTPSGIAGIEVAEGRGIDVASDWAQFAEKVVRLVSDVELRRVWSDSAIELVKNHFAPEVAYGPICTWIRNQA